MLHSNLNINEKGHLTFGGVDTVFLAEKYGTSLMVIDEDKVRENCRLYLSAMRKYFTPSSRPLFASKSLCFKKIYEIIASEGVSTDIVSPGELYTALKAGFPLQNAYFHGNNKTDEDIEFAIDSNIGYFIVDNFEELDKIDSYAEKKGINQKILLRLTPGIDPHTHAKISTGKVDSKFGNAIETGQASEIVAAAMSKKNVTLLGFHCHIGSQIFEIEPFCDAADIMLNFLAESQKKYSCRFPLLNLGGGFGVRYTEKDPEINIEKNIKEISEHISSACEKAEIEMPDILMEPGRSLVANAGLTLYTVGSVKNIRGYKSYVSIDGGMTDNPRYALYQSEYTVLIANKADKPKDLVATVAGRCCESGDLIGEDMRLQKAERGDILAVLVTGAYNYSMASNYNKICRPAIVMVSGGKDVLAVRRESFEDLISLDV